MVFVFDRLYRLLGRRYFWAYFAFAFTSSLFVTAGTVGLVTLYGDVSGEQFVRILVVAEGCTLVGMAVGTFKATRFARPLLDFVKDPDGADLYAAWRTGVTMPRDFVMRTGWIPYAVVSAPVAAYATFELGLPWWGFPVLLAGTAVAIGYSVILHSFGAEFAARPVLLDIYSRLPADFAAVQTSSSLRVKLLGALPVINVITGVVVSGLSTSQRASLGDLGLDVLVAVVVAFTLSFELTLLLTKSILWPVQELLDATERVKHGDLSARVPVVSGDELGQLAGSFNEMLRGLDERERLREAFGSYVDPGVAERVLEEGEMLEGEEVEVSVMFIDIRDFTGWSENASAREAVAYLNDFFGIVVPLLGKHGGHANKFVGDGLMGVFGAPERQPDHADRAVAAACEIAHEVEHRLGGEVRIGIGINSGPVVAGSIGGGGRLEFTVIGDPVNVASRVESATRDSDAVVLVTEATRTLMTRDDVELEPRDTITVKGKSDPLGVYAPRLPSLDREQAAAASREAAAAS